MRPTTAALLAVLGLAGANPGVITYFTPRSLSLPPDAPLASEPQEPVQRHATPLALPSTMASDLLSPRRTPASPETQAALAELTRAFASLNGQPGRGRPVC